MKFVSITSIVLLFASVLAYGLKCHRDAVEVASPGPGFYEHFAAIQVRLRLRHQAVAAAPKRTPKHATRSEFVGS